MPPLEFKPSTFLSFGVELELQLVNTRDWDLTRGATDLLALLEKGKHPGDVKPEITESMIEISTSVHSCYETLAEELRAIRDAVVKAADRLNIGVAGGGAHPFQRWSERQICDRPRFRHLSDLYGYLAKQFTVFGQHIHVGCRDGDQALELMHGLARYIPHFIALSAASPYYQGVDTAFDSSRLNAIFAFPLSGRAPFLTRWSEFNGYFEKMAGSGIVGSMKDFYWDIRPSPGYGTLEIRVCDTPLTVERAAVLAAYAQALCRFLHEERPFQLKEEMYLVYTYNRFLACRFGLDADLVDPEKGTRRTLKEDISATCERLRPHARELGAEAALEEVLSWIQRGGNDARWMREVYAETHSLQDLVWRQTGRWRGEGG
ncbi:YbdK family carboxylate-amine ligase [Pelomicrobium sp.]|jgi:carboxylate-amine ligase|uniref:YbdK family carboxylate-amine ligase n=1 Tax=Pelomicrobium sp. TaxID=2815319 RepID=UPI002FDC802C